LSFTGWGAALRDISPVGNIAFQGNSVRPDGLIPVSRHADSLSEPAIALAMPVNRELPVVRY